MHDLNISLEDMKIFYYVVTKGGFSKAGEALNIPQGKVSRHVARLEEVFGTPLLYRDMRFIRPTETGHLVFDSVKHVLEHMVGVHAHVRHQHKHIGGEINLTVAAGFANTWFIKQLPEFRTRYPEIILSLATNETGNGDLMMGETDIAITSSKPSRRESLTCEVLCEYPFYIYASKDYLKLKGTPKSVTDLDHHDIVAIPDSVASTFNKTLIGALLYLGRS